MNPEASEVRAFDAVVAANFETAMAALALMSALTKVPSNIIEDVILPVSAVLIKLPDVGRVKDVVPVVVKVKECAGNINVLTPDPAVA